MWEEGRKPFLDLAHKTHQLRREDFEDLEVGRATSCKQPESLKHCLEENYPTRNNACTVHEEEKMSSIRSLGFGGSLLH